MLRKASAKRRIKTEEKLNLVPILDAVFIFIFFLLASSQFVKMYELSSDVPTVSNEPVPQKDNKIPLNLTVKLISGSAEIYTGVPGKRIHSIPNKGNEYDFDQLHDYLVSIKSKNTDEKTIILEPASKLDYQIVVNLMDAVRLMKFSDPKLTYNDQVTGEEKEVKFLFDDIIFGNLES